MGKMRQMTGVNSNLHKAKDAKNDEFYISSSWKLLSFRLNEDYDICDRETSGFYEGGSF